MVLLGVSAVNGADVGVLAAGEFGVGGDWPADVTLAESDFLRPLLLDRT
jgi:hypothetical protein